MTAPSHDSSKPPSDAPDDRGAIEPPRAAGNGRYTVMRFAGVGMELAGLALGGGFVGYLLDRYVLTAERPWGLIVGGLIGFAAGMSHLVVLAQRFNRSGRQ